MPYIVYNCDYCDFIEDLRTDVEKHELTCRHNPANKTCETCNWYKCEMGAQYCSKRKDVDIVGALNCKMWKRY